MTSLLDIPGTKRPPARGVAIIRNCHRPGEWEVVHAGAEMAIIPGWFSREDAATIAAYLNAGPVDWTAAPTDLDLSEEGPAGRMRRGGELVALALRFERIAALLSDVGRILRETAGTAGATPAQEHAALLRCWRLMKGCGHEISRLAPDLTHRRVTASRLVRRMKALRSIGVSL